MAARGSRRLDLGLGVVFDQPARCFVAGDTNAELDFQLELSGCDSKFGAPSHANRLYD